MTDREKVIKGLECCLGSNDCDVEPEEDCPYKGMCLCAMALRFDVFALLKESVPQGVVDQIRWERDTALSQLKEIGKGLGEKMDDIVALLKEQEVGEAKMKWDQYEKQMPIKSEEWQYKTQINVECPKCGKKIWRRNDIVLTSYPAKYQYECECGWVGYAHI